MSFHRFFHLNNKKKNPKYFYWQKNSFSRAYAFIVRQMAAEFGFYIEMKIYNIKNSTKKDIFWWKIRENIGDGEKSFFFSASKLVS